MITKKLKNLVNLKNVVIGFGITDKDNKIA